MFAAIYIFLLKNIRSIVKIGKSHYHASINRLQKKSGPDMARSLDLILIDFGL